MPSYSALKTFVFLQISSFKRYYISIRLRVYRPDKSAAAVSEK